MMNNPFYKDGRTFKVYYCIVCGKIQIPWRSALHGSGRCIKCYRESLKGAGNPMHGKSQPHLIKWNKDHRNIGIKSPVWKINRPKCCDCGKQLKCFRIKRCRKCFIKFNRGKNHPAFGKITHVRYPRYLKYKNIWMHSSWEVAYAKYLDKNRWHWFYEYKTFDLGDTTYTPDFYLPKSKEYIEIKGYWRDDAFLKFRLFRKNYPDIKIRVLTQKNLKRLKIL